MQLKIIPVLIVTALARTSGFGAESAKTTPGDLTRLSLEELTQVEVT